MSLQRNVAEPETETIIQVEPDFNENLLCSESSADALKRRLISHQPTHATIDSKEIKA